MSTAQTTPTTAPYLVLARKYRSQTFAELKGQEALVQTFQNAITHNRLHHAYVLTGIRGVGKTSIARLIAKALNCTDGPNTTWAADDPQVAAITKGTHPDVLEFDAASHTGVDDIRELFEGVAYAPIQGTYKVYIIDEVHMLSKAAFNALLKTLEEPPENVIFLFATTEVHKIPVTVLSRCQRFDLKRLSASQLEDHFNEILSKESIKAEAAAVQLIARAADGSVRDGLSLLDQAIALAAGEEVSSALVSKMLGLADRARIWTLLEQLFAGDTAATFAASDELHALGVDPLLVAQDLLACLHLLTRLKLVPDLATSGSLSELEQNTGAKLAQQVALDQLSRAYQTLLKGAEEIKIAARPHEALAMALVRVTHLAALPPMSVLLQADAAQGEGASAATAPKKPQVQHSADVTTPAAIEAAAPAESPPWEPTPAEPTTKKVAPKQPQSWAEVVALLQNHEPALAAVLTQQARCSVFAEGAITLKIDNGIHTAADILRRLGQALKQHTGQKWAITEDMNASAEATETLHETSEREAQERLEAAKANPDVQKILAQFPGATLERVD
jgi:DNA polymerase-3 subunit gamma/tau